MRGREIDRFIPIAYEMPGTWGTVATVARSFFKFVVKAPGRRGLGLLNFITGQQ